MSKRWARPIAERLRKHGQAVTSLSHDRSGLQSQLPYRGDLLYVGHGTADELGIPPLIDATNAGEIEGMIVAVACRSAQRLGPDAVRAGVRNYVGFIDDLHVIRSRIIDDVIVEHFRPLVIGAWSPGEFESRFRAVCQRVQDERFSGWRLRQRNAYLTANAAQIMKLAIRVL
jgi:hypothetical protein